MNLPSMDPGLLRHRLRLECQNEVSDGCGGFTTNWQLVAQVWAAIEPITNSQRTEVGALDALTSHKITIRWRSDCLPQMRLLKSGREFLINTIVDTDETKRYLMCICEENK